ncbi:MAG: phosphate signaling complex protein PhoU [Bdellovibrionaceae bacterium]|nr:phosphate signaling complex protein PhoU [Pseudobdellovibrionaceae bacterium]
MAAVERQFQNQLDEIKSLLLSMGNSVEKALETVVTGLIQRDLEKLEGVFAIEERINHYQVELDQVCTEFLAKQGPVATDLRLVISIIKINSDLERMGDQCVNISHSAKDFIQQKGSFSLQDIQVMAAVAQKMVKDALDCFVTRNAEVAQKVLMTDDELDQRKQQVFNQMVAAMKKDSTVVEPAMDLILIARNLERMGDHATNIAEDVIFVSTGKDIRHGKYS